jgi:lipid-A-disaccharide synthase-like uncharacterized protein
VSPLALWVTVGFLGQALFTARFAVQWIASERQGDSVVPVAFWWLSLLGGTALLSYAIARRDPVIIMGQGMSLFVYTRNLILLRKTRRIPPAVRLARTSAPRDRRALPNPTRYGTRERLFMALSDSSAAR